MLIKQCICSSTNLSLSDHHNIPTFECDDCGVIHQRLDMEPVDYFKFYTDEYHSSFQEGRGTLTYEERYEHDYHISELRADEYEEFLKEGMATLDIGSSNNAFVDLMNKLGMKAQGIEIGEEGAKYPDTTFNQDLLTLDLPANTYGLITMHDVLEHLIDPRPYLQEMHHILADDGVVVIDFPHFFVDEGIHHWKAVEHLWFLNMEQTVNLIESEGFTVFDVRVPIASKFVVYAKKAS